MYIGTCSICGGKVLGESGICETCGAFRKLPVIPMEPSYPGYYPWYPPYSPPYYPRYYVNYSGDTGVNC